MPYLQLDVPGRYPVGVKREAARRIAALYARAMDTTPARVTVGFRELGEGNLWTALDGDGEPGAIVMCDVRAGRTPDQRAELARGLIAVCVELLGLRDDRLVVEFTQHAGDEMYRAAGGWSADWAADEGGRRSG
ncbi:MAG TPA: tautomerase family protein [Urbifossiella sp.]|jgi:phenylpyruvate tautomerase PptA (4-oxalocrotonate tautomerase family)|nr:tautomerase family protein [Urbifossiella sp.]